MRKSLYKKFFSISACTLFTWLSSTIVLAQDKVISGTVTDGESPLPGVNVVVKGTSTGTITNYEGIFSIQMPQDINTLVFSYVGYKRKEVEVNSQSSISVNLEEDLTQLGEIVVTGYSEQEKRDLTGAVSIVKVGSVKNFPVAGVDQMLQGQAAGVNVVNDYAPGGGVSVRVRGFSTIRNNDPLYIIDGVPTTSGLNMINPNDIESIQVLKDASSASIYGSRAANGVVIITTKKGKSDEPSLTFDAFAGVQNVFNLPNMLNAQQYGDLLWQAIRNDGGTPANDVYGSGASPVIPAFLDAEQMVPSANVDWPEQLFEAAPIQSYNLTFSKGGENSQQVFALGYFNQQGIMKYTGFERISARLNSDFTLFDRLTIGENLTASYSWNNSVTNNSSLGGALYSSYRFPSISPVKDNMGDFAGSPLNDISNPLGGLYRNKDNTRKNLKVFGNIFADLKIIEGLNFRTNLGIDYNSGNFRQFSPSFSERAGLSAVRLESELSTQNTYDYSWVWSNTLQYNKTINKHSIDLLGGMEAIHTYNESFGASRVGFPFNDPNFRFLDAGDGSEQRNFGNATEWSLFSYFGKINYSYDQRYLASFTFRRDGASRLGDNKWGSFPALSLGWRISEENFFALDQVSDLKLRFGWGQNGNQDIPAYSTFSSYISNPFHSNYALNGAQNAVNTGYTQTRVGNPLLRWETTTQTNFGLDLGLFDNALEVSADYFIKKTEDLLLEKPLPPVVGGTNQTVWDNVGSMENKGLEMIINYRSNPAREFVYNIGVNFTAMSNELTSLPDDIDFITIPGSILHVVNFGQSVSRTDVGQPIASFYGHRVSGIFQNEAEISNHAEQPNAKPGDFRFEDINNDGSIDNDDRTFIGSPHPDFTYGINMGANYKNFDLSLFFQGSQGNDIYDLTRYFGDFYNLSAYNKQSRTLNAWTTENSGTDIPRLSLDDPNNNIRPSSYYVRDGSFLRLKNIQLGYNIPLKEAGFKDLRVYVQAQNLFTITGYEGLDPEVGLQNYSSENRNLDIGVDRGIYPPSRSFLVGVNLNF